MPRDLQRAVHLLRRSLAVGLEPPDPETQSLLALPERQEAARPLHAAQPKPR